MAVAHEGKAHCIGYYALIRLFLTIRTLLNAGESLEQLEARALLYRFYVRLGMLPDVRRD